MCFYYLLSDYLNCYSCYILVLFTYLFSFYVRVCPYFCFLFFPLFLNEMFFRTELPCVSIYEVWPNQRLNHQNLPQTLIRTSKQTTVSTMPSFLPCRFHFPDDDGAMKTGCGKYYEHRNSPQAAVRSDHDPKILRTSPAVGRCASRTGVLPVRGALHYADDVMTREGWKKITTSQLAMSLTIIIIGAAMAHWRPHERRLLFLAKITILYHFCMGDFGFSSALFPIIAVIDHRSR